MSILQVEDLTKIYNEQSPVTALQDANFSVEKGEFVAIIGPSGSGKSTLLHMLGGVQRPTKGKVRIEDTDMYALGEEQRAIFRRRQIGLIYQMYNLIPVLTVEENIALPLVLDGVAVSGEKVAHLIEVLGLQGKEKSLPSRLSGGQQQRASIGRALIHTPSIVLADEPTGNLDSRNSKEVIELLKMSNRANKQTLILITHDESIALQADRILSIEDGRIVSDQRMY